MNRIATILSALLCLSARAALGASIDVNLDYTPLGGGVFQYDVSVTNNGPDDVAIVSIVDAPENDALIAPSLEAPVGYDASYDPGLGLGFGFVDFLEDTALFAANTTVSGFRFQSDSSPPDFFTSFEALTLGGELISGSIRVQQQPVPDAGSTAIMTLLGGLAVCGFRRRNSGFQP